MMHTPAHKNTAAPAAQLRATPAPVSQGPDFTLVNHGSISTLEPRTDAARHWVDEHIPADAQWWGNGVVIEWRFVDDIVAGIEADELSIN